MISLSANRCKKKGGLKPDVKKLLPMKHQNMINDKPDCAVCSGGG